MPSIDDVVSLSITKSTATASRVSFGIGMILASGLSWTERVRTYKKLSAVLTDFPASGGVDHPVYKAAARYFSQRPRPKTFKVGRRANAFTETYTIKCLISTTGYVYSIPIEGTTITYTVPSSSTTTTVATAIAALIDALSTVAATSSTDTITVTASSASKVLRVGPVLASEVQIKNTTPDPGIVADYTAIKAEDPDFHDVGLDSQSHAQIAALAATIAAEDRELWFDTSDTLVETTSTADIGSVLKAAAYDNVIGFYNKKSSVNYRCFAAMSVAAARDPGSYTLMFKELKGDEGADVLQDTEDGYVAGKNMNRYADLSAGPQTLTGVASSGEYEDVTRFLHWVTQEIKARVLEALKGPDKVPFTNPGIAVVENAIRGVLDDGITVGGIAPTRADADTAYDVNVPLAEDVTTADKSARNLPDVEFAFELAGAIHSVSVEGTVSV